MSERGTTSSDSSAVLSFTFPMTTTGDKSSTSTDSSTVLSSTALNTTMSERDIKRCLFEGCDTYEVCDTFKGVCICKDGYERSEGDKCHAKNFCSTTCTGKHTKCMPGSDESPRNITCTCEEGYTKNQKTGDCVPTFCETGRHNCKENEVCKAISDGDKGYACTCSLPFVKQDNKCALPNIDECSDFVNCGVGGKCLKVNSQNKCFCQEGYVLENSICIEYCNSSSWMANPLRDICPSQHCDVGTGGNIRCKCGGIWEEDIDGFSCKLKPLCNGENEGKRTCSLENADCNLDETIAEGFSCTCPFGYRRDALGKCKAVCAFHENTEKCQRYFADCVVDRNGNATCQCKPSFKNFIEGQHCQLAGAAYTVKLTFLNRYNTLSSAPPGVFLTESLDRNQLLKDIELTMNIQYGKNFLSTVITDVYYTDSEVHCSLSLQFHEEEESLNRITSNNICVGIQSSPNNDSETSDYCVILPSLVVNRKKLKGSTIEPINQCLNPVKYCSSYTKCVKHNGTIGYSCLCRDNFVTLHSYALGKVGKIEYCQDIDECANPDVCPNFTKCINTVGSYSCQCVEKYKVKISDDNPNSTECIGAKRVTPAVDVRK
ncbi:fibrillin-1-like [Limulus polyphemus]|uniref:Fibrillin-1-like n=1 Tax=Limulus polyphemus TaxID=6850 RepID=A0ABM1TGA9_LIMPO|nr:fibrillin-1-like [Limulus polyphemus]